jgi:hypothetical protein
MRPWRLSEVRKNMNTGNQNRPLDVRIRAAIQHAVRVIERDWFNVLVFGSAACHMGSCAGFTSDEELVQRYLGTPRE